MTKKLPAPDDDEALALAVRDSAQQIWQAGLGAFAKAQAGSSKLEQVFEERVARALGALGVPTPQEWQALNARVEQLSKALEELSGKKLAAPKAPAKAKAAAKPAAAKKRAAKGAA